jgi:hypothetical protein
MTDDKVSGAILHGAYAKWIGYDKLSDNPYADMPGSYVMHRAWRYGYLNSEAVIMEHCERQEPIRAAVRPKVRARG